MKFYMKILDYLKPDLKILKKIRFRSSLSIKFPDLHLNFKVILRSSCSEIGIVLYDP